MYGWRGATARGPSRPSEKALVIAERLAAKEPGNAEWQRDVSVSYNKIGDVRLEGGDRKGALEAYEKALVITERLTVKDPGNAEWQFDVSVSYERIGDVPYRRGRPQGGPRGLTRRPSPSPRAPRRKGPRQC